ncbi:MAG: lipid-binding SYLF domain-containing protein [Pseudohongiellaceae bacterium]|jgi:lipid-binding SYLF domain-containing protein
MDILMPKSKLLLGYVLLSIFLNSCTTTGLNSGTPAQRRDGIQSMRQDVLKELYELKPDTRAQLDSATGYAVFANANINIIFASFGGGYGVVRDNQSSQDTYMRMGEIGIGLGAGVKDFRAVFVFHNASALARFMDVGVSVGGQADAAAKAGDLGAAVSGEAVLDNVTVYQLTQSGLALQATVKGTRYWQDTDLN